MAKTIIVIEDRDLEEGTVNSTVSYDIPTEEQIGDKEISSAIAYGYTVHYLFETGIINQYLPEAMQHIADNQGN